MSAAARAGGGAGLAAAIPDGNHSGCGGPPGHSPKAFASLRARAALIGYSLCTVTEFDGLGFYLLSRWGMSRTLPDLAAVAVLLRTLGAPE